MTGSFLSPVSPISLPVCFCRWKKTAKTTPFLPWSWGTFSTSVISPFLLLFFFKSTFYFCLILSILILSKRENTAQSSSQVVGKSTLEMPPGIIFVCPFSTPSGSLTQNLENKLEGTSLLPEFNHYR